MGRVETKCCSDVDSVVDELLQERSREARNMISHQRQEDLADCSISKVAASDADAAFMKVKDIEPTDVEGALLEMQGTVPSDSDTWGEGLPEEGTLRKTIPCKARKDKGMEPAEPAREVDALLVQKRVLLEMPGNIVKESTDSDACAFPVGGGLPEKGTVGQTIPRKDKDIEAAERTRDVDALLVQKGVLLEMPGNGPTEPADSDACAFPVGGGLPEKGTLGQTIPRKDKDIEAAEPTRDADALLVQKGVLLEMPGNIVKESTDYACALRMGVGLPERGNLGQTVPGKEGDLKQQQQQQEAEPPSPHATSLSRSSNHRYQQPGAYSNIPGQTCAAQRMQTVDYGSAMTITNDTQEESCNNPFDGSADNDQHNDHHHRLLAEARPIKEDEETAQRAQPLEEEHVLDSSSQKDEVAVPSKWFCCRLGVLAIILGVVAAVLTALILVVSRNTTGFPATVALGPTATMPPTTVSPSALFTEEELVLSLLPPETVNAISQRPGSPQGQSLEWMLQDPHLQEYTRERILQRYALATFYFATGGPSTWAHTTRWLSYDQHECSWYFNAAAFGEYFGIEFHSPCLLLPPQENDVKDSHHHHGEKYHYFHLESNGLQGSIPDELYLLTNLRDLNVGLNDGLTGPISPSIGHLSKLEALSFALCHITGTVPTEIGLMSNALRYVYLWAELDGNLPSELGLLTTLIELDMADNFLSSTIPSELGNLHRNLAVLFIGGQSLSGTIPTQLGRLSQLQELGLMGNKLTGSLPSELGLLEAAHYFNTAGNQLDHTIPTEVGQLTALIQLDLSNNLHTGRIPTELGHLAEVPKNANMDSYHFEVSREAGRMVRLIMARNQLEGNLPSQIGLLTDLEMVDVHDNLLTGQIPVDWWEHQLTALETLNVMDNSLSGAIPETWCELLPGLAFECSPASLLCGCNCTCSYYYNDTTA